jgi:hypothetical protein
VHHAAGGSPNIGVVRFMIHEPGYQTSIAALQDAMGDKEFESASERCKLRWVVAASFPGMLRKIEPGIGRIFQINQRRLLKKLERVAREHPTPA